MLTQIYQSERKKGIIKVLDGIEWLLIPIRKQPGHEIDAVHIELNAPEQANIQARLWGTITAQGKHQINECRPISNSLMEAAQELL